MMTQQKESPKMKEGYQMPPLMELFKFHFDSTP